jgi:predicted transcriptional regulator
MNEEKSEPNTQSTEQTNQNLNTNSQKVNSTEDLEMKIEEDDNLTPLKNAITKFLSEHTIYEAIPEDMKILVFNDKLLIKDSIEAMIKEDIYCGLLYSSEKNKHSGIFTIRDVLGLLLVGYKKLVMFLNPLSSPNRVHTPGKSGNISWGVGFVRRTQRVNNEKDINSYEKLKIKENSDKFFATFDTNVQNNNNNENDKTIIISKSLENKENNDNNNVDMDIEEEKNINNQNNETKESEITQEQTIAYNNIIKDFNHFISLFDEITLQSFIDLFHIKDTGSLISLYSESNLEECIKTIQNKNIHRLIVNDKKTGNLSGFITYETVFEYFIENYYSEMTEFNIPLKQINLVINNVITLNKNETLHKCMETFYNKGISMLPILDDDGKIFGYFYLKDIIYFFSMGEKFNFNNTVENFLKDLYEDVDNEMPYGKRRIKELNDNTSLKSVFEEMSTSPERKLIIKNSDSKIGIIALYDIFKKLVI